MKSAMKKTRQSSMVLFDKQYEKSPLLRDVHDFWTCSEEGRFCLHTLTELDTVEELADQQNQRQIRTPESSISSLHSPYDRFMDEGNERWFRHLCAPVKGKVPEISVNVASKICQDQIFRKEFDPAAFSDALQGIDYIDSIEYARNKAVRDIGKKWKVTDWTYGELLHGHPGPLNWIKDMKETDKMLNYHYTELYTSLRIWTMAVHLKYTTPCDKSNSVALLNTLFPPIADGDIIAPIPKDVILQWRSLYYNMILQLSGSDGSYLPDFDFDIFYSETLREGGPYRWSGVRKHLDSYFLLVKTAMSHIDEGLKIDYVPPQPRAFAVRPSIDNLYPRAALKQRQLRRISASMSHLPSAPTNLLPTLSPLPGTPGTGGHIQGSPRSSVPEGVPQETGDLGAGLGIRQVPGVTPMIGHEDVTIAGRPYSQLPVADENTISVVPKKGLLSGLARRIHPVKSVGALPSLPVIETIEGLSYEEAEQVRDRLLGAKKHTPKEPEVQKNLHHKDVLEAHREIQDRRVELDFDKGIMDRAYLDMAREDRLRRNTQSSKAGSNKGEKHGWKQKIKASLREGVGTLGGGY